MALFWFPLRSAPKKLMTAALLAASSHAFFAPAVGVTHRKRQIMTNDTPTTDAEANAQRDQIAKLNDQCRQAMGIAGKLFQTEGISALPLTDQSAIREKVETFNEFSPDNNPYGERDFGAFEHNGQRIFWKIDYYARDMMHGSENPADPKQTVRVLTIMLASEY